MKLAHTDTRTAITTVECFLRSLMEQRVSLARLNTRVYMVTSFCLYQGQVVGTMASLRPYIGGGVAGAEQSLLWKA